MRFASVALLSALLFVGCDKIPAPRKTVHQKPPIGLEVIAPAVAKQLTDRFADRGGKVGKVRFEGSSDFYHVEVFYMQKDREKRYAMELQRMMDGDRPNLVIYGGRFPTILFADKTIAHSTHFTVTVDEMMNEGHDSQPPPERDK
jgi:hypothetical protein